MDSSFAAALAEAVARRWLVPSPRRRDHVSPGERISRIVPPEPLWADDWLPTALHVARISATLYRDGRRPSARVTRASGDALFDASLETIFGDSPHDHPLPSFPAAVTGDSIQVIVGLGETPDSVATGVARFAAQQRPARMTTRPRITAPPLAGPGAPRFARVKYDVGADGRIGQVEVLATSDPGFASAVRAGLRQARFAPPQSNCRAISQTMVQNFGAPGPSRASPSASMHPVPRPKPRAPCDAQPAALSSAAAAQPRSPLPSRRASLPCRLTAVRAMYRLLFFCDTFADTSPWKTLDHG